MRAGGRQHGGRRVQAGFEWVSNAVSVPARWDLRLLGWSLGTGSTAETLPRLYDGRAGQRRSDWRQLGQAGLTAAVGVDCADERAAMLAHGLGEALSSLIALDELAIRLSRLVDEAGALPRHRRLGPVTLDLLHRDARAGDRWLALHPREFALLWRLADAPGERVGREALLADVWRLRHVPETNSLEVHVSRLRAKLAVARAAWLVETDPRGGYRLAKLNREARWTAPAPVPTLAAT